MTPRYELRQISVSPTITWRSQAPVTASSNSTSPPGATGEKASSSATQALCVCCLLVDELAAHPVPGGQVADRLRTGQRLDGQVLAAALGQRPDRRTNTSGHTRLTGETPKVPSPTPAAPTQLRVCPGFEPRLAAH